MTSITEKIAKDDSSDQKSLISLRKEFKYKQEDSNFSSSFFEQEAFLSSLLNTVTSSDVTYQEPHKLTHTEKQNKPEVFSAHIERVDLEAWKNTDNYSARLVEINDSFVTLECLVDKEKGIYEERTFKLNLFQNYNLELGKLFFLRFFERASEIKLQIHDDSGLPLEDDFPKTSLAKKYKNSRLFK